MFDAKVEVMIGDITTTYMGLIKCIFQPVLYRQQFTFSCLEDTFRNMHKGTIVVHEMRIIFFQNVLSMKITFLGFEFIHIL